MPRQGLQLVEGTSSVPVIVDELDEVEVSARRLAGVPTASWVAAREDHRRFETAIETNEDSRVDAFVPELTELDLEHDPIDDDDSERSDTPQPLFDPKEAMIFSGIQPIDKERADLVTRLEGGFDPLFRHLLDKIMGRQNTLAGTLQSQASHAIWHTLLSMDSKILRCLLEGNLVQQNKRNREVRTALHRQRRRADQAQQPCIYANFVTSSNGDAPTVEETLEIVQFMERYTNIAANISQQDLDLAYRVDVALQPSVARARRWNKALTEAGHRRYLAKDGYITPAQLAYTQGVHTFAEAVRRRVQSLNLSDEDMKNPFNPAMTEIGYTCNCEGRLREHRSHRCSNRLMNLFEAVCMVLFGNRYRIRQFVIYLVWEPDQAAVAEIIFTILLNGFIGQGAGFTFCNPGISVASARKVPVKQWTEFAAWAVHQSPYLKNNTAEDLRLLQDQDKEQSLVANLAKVQAEIQQIEIEREREDATQEVQTEISTLVDATPPWILTYHIALVQHDLQNWGREGTGREGTGREGSVGGGADGELSLCRYDYTVDP